MTDAQLETAPKKGETAAQFKGRIEETAREIARQNAKPVTVPDPTPAPAQVSAPGTVAQPTSEPAAPAITGNKEVDEWWVKKGFKTPQDLEQSYRELERELTRKNQELARQNVPGNQPPPMAPPNGYPPYVPVPPSSWTPPPAYVPPTYVPPPPQQTVESLAEQYGLSPEDFKKVYAIANDLSQVTVQRELNRVMPGIVQQVRQVNGEVVRQREMVDLMSEPTWKNPQVQFEMHKVLNEDPTLIQRQALPYRYAHDEALKRIARVNLGGSNAFSPQPTPPASSGGRPPSTAGSNGKGADVAPGGPGNGEMTDIQFAALSIEQKREFLQTLGAMAR